MKTQRYCDGPCRAPGPSRRRRTSSSTSISSWAALGVAALVAGCTHAPTAPPPRTLERDEVAALVPEKVVDRAGWADDVLTALRLIDKPATPERVCAVLAVIEQESGFQADPPVPNLPRIVRTALEEKLAPLGPLQGPALAALLEGKAPGSSTTFGARIDKLKTERDLDRLFRDLQAAYRAQMPGTFAVAGALSLLLGKGSLADLNPVTTAGSMQVKVSFARELGAADGLDDDEVREQLYTRAGGVRFGTARLIAYPARYDDIVFRFADYNAGMYTSRNAALQQQLGDLVGEKLVLDGDLLAYDADGDPKDVDTNSLRALIAFGATHDLSEWRVRRDAKKEKSLAFEDTDTYRAIRQAWEQRHERAAPYARIPEVELSSPKMSKARSTSWFAQSVLGRYQRCRART